MKKQLLFYLVLLIAVFQSFGQNTAIPDPNFEQALIDLGIDTNATIDGVVPTANISGVQTLNVASKNIADLTGIEDFTALTNLNCYNNQLTSLNVSNNTALTYLECRTNMLTSLDVSTNTALTHLYSQNNQLTSLDVSNNTALTNLACQSNQITRLDVRNNTVLTFLFCHANQLTSLDVRNGNNTIINNFNATSNPSLTCIAVDDAAYSTTNWGNRDAGASFSTQCKTYVPDDNFEAYLEANGMGNGIANDDYVTTANISGVQTLTVNSKNIADLTGIEDFTALTNLNCEWNQLTSIDISNNTALTVLYCNNNQLTSLNVSNNTALTELICKSNQLTSMDISNNTALTELGCSTNYLTSLDISNNTALTNLNCGYNQLTSLNVSNNTALTSFSCYFNQLTSLDVNNNIALTSFNCFFNQLTSLDVRNGNNTIINNFNATNNPSLTCIAVDDAAYSTTNWTNKDAAASFSEDCTPKTYVPDDNFEAYLEANGMGNGIANDDYVTTANISGVQSLNVNSQNIADLTGIEDFTALTNFNCQYNQLTSIDISNNTAFTELNCQYNQLTSLNVSNNTALAELYCGYNQLTSLNVSTNTALTHLYSNDNQLTSLNVSNNTALTELICQNNQLTSIDISNNTALTELGCAFNNLTSLDVSNNTALTNFNFQSNQLTSIDISNNTALTELNCGYNQLTSLNVSNNTALTYFGCYDNDLTSLDVTSNTALIYLFCGYNQLTSLNVSNNTALTYLDCYDNDLTSLDVRNGNNTNFFYFYATNNPSLTCIAVDDAAYSTTNWTNKDPGASFSEDCATLNVSNFDTTALVLYPNPVNTSFTIQGLNNELSSLQIVNLQGQIVKEVSNYNAQPVSINNLANGMYFVNISTTKGQHTIKIIKE